MKKSVKDLTDIKGKRALVRVDMNVPFDENGKVSDDTRIRAILPTVQYLKEKGAKVILMAHLGRPKGEKKPELKLDPVAKRLAELLESPVMKLDDCIGEEVKEKLSEMNDGDVALLENIRFYNEETKNDSEFAQKLADLADFYVNDAFGAAHRAHASTEGVAKLLSPAVSGLLMEKELIALGSILENPKRPFIAIVGGSKVSTKIAVIENLITKCDTVVLGGGMTYTFKKAMGGKIGNSICEDDKLDFAKELMKTAQEKGVKLIIAEDVLAADDFSNNANIKFVASDDIPDGWEGVDAGPKTIKAIADAVLESKTILWNGPVGAFETDLFEEGTKAVALAVQEATKNGATSVLGGGDTVAAVEKFKLDRNSFSHISTGGGASLEFIEGKELPGVAALDDK
ncbi:MAG: phosphoglycerate kinase [Candidatus Gastranaerophilales bacterium]|nr:phosphoglycerate kinase [Candidatus Gastranaerophilales bacterium]